MPRFDESNDMPRVPGIYIIRNTVNEKCYVGSTINLRTRKFSHFTSLQKGSHKNPHLQNAFNAYGVAAFEFSVAELVSDKQNLLIREQHYIDILHPEYNIAPKAGNTLGMKLSLETRQKMSRSRMGRISPNLGKKASPETRAKVAATSRGRIGSPEKRAKLSALHKGRIKSLEERAKISAALKGKSNLRRRGQPISDAQKAAISAANTGRKHSEEWKIEQGKRTKQMAGRFHTDAFKAALAERNRQRAGILHTSEHNAKITEGNKRRWARVRAKQEAERLAREQALLVRMERVDSTASTLDPSAYKPLSLWDNIEPAS